MGELVRNRPRFTQHTERAMQTKRAVAKRLMAELKCAYAAIDSQPYEADPERMAQATGRYDGLKRAYVLLTGRPEQEVAHEVVGWYIHTPEYQERKQTERGES